MSVSVVNCIAFGAYTTTVRKIADDPDKPKMIHNFLGGAVAGAAVCSLSPIELVKIRQQGIQGKKLVSPITITKQIYQKGGIFSSNGLYRGFFTQLARDPFGYAAYYLPYLLVAELVAKNGGVDPVPILVGGATAGFFSWMITNPFDVVKTIYQSEAKKKSVRSVLKQLLKREGTTGLTRGIMANSVRGIPQSAAVFFGYEKTLEFLKDTEKI